MKSISTCHRPLNAVLAVVTVLAVVSPAWGQLGAGQNQNDAANQRLQRFQQIAANSQTELGLEGYCPVCIVNKQKWVAGQPSFSTVYDGKTYFFPGDGPRQEFLRNPAKYVPALGGDCTVCFEKFGKRLPGNIRFALLHNSRLYLFPSANERTAFNRTPQAFEDTDLAIDGNCIVCQVKMNKHVKGDPEFTAVHNGFRYQFPSDRERQTFISSPRQYVTAIGNTNRTMRTSTTSHRIPSQSMKIANQVEVKGTTACAGCEFGVTPIGAPEELGLAVTTGDGKVYVIEEGHSRWPEVYKQRFKGQPVAVSGKIIKTLGNISWIQPSSLTAL